MIALLRFVGLMNAAVWLGGTAYQLLAAGPFFYSAAAKWLLGEPHAIGAGFMLSHRFYALQYLCLGVAWAHLIAEWVYLGKSFSKFNVWCLSLLLGSALAGQAMLSHAIEPMHWARVSPRTPAAEKERATRVLPIWSATRGVTDVLMSLGVALFCWRSLTANPGPRFMTQARFRTPESPEM